MGTLLHLPLRSCSRASLDGLPPEVLSQILSYLVPAVPDVGETRPMAYNQLIPEEPWFEPTRARVGLYSACLVSRNLMLAARPQRCSALPLSGP